MFSLRFHARSLAASVVVAAVSASPAHTQQAQDTTYTRIIRELTPTDPNFKFTTELVDHLPASATVPTPLKVLGYVPGTVGRLSYVADVNRFFRELARTSPRVKIFSLGMSDEGREMIVAAISEEANIGRLDAIKADLGKLADPRGLPAIERARIIRDVPPIYWLTGTIHSPETGSPEMLMELAYRLAVEETAHVQAIRKNVITLITPVVEVDGRDRMVDVYKLSKELKLGPRGTSLVYWGKYTAHDNNRDAIGMSQKLTQNYNRGFFTWHPQITHDLHESVPFLYTSTGTGPYNDEFDPIVVSEWHTLAYQEITELTRRGLPGVWTHGFYDGWAPNYMLAIANLHNSLGKFYETYTSQGADCHVVDLPAASTRREWDRPNPPVNGVRWCIRSNINYQQSGVLIALKYVGDNRATFMENFASKAERMIRRGQTNPPYAFVIPRAQRHSAEAASLVNLLRLHGTEVQVATSEFTTMAGRKIVENPVSNAPPGGYPTARRDSAQTREPSDPNARVAAMVDSVRGRDTTASPRRGAAALNTRVTVKPGDWIIRMDQPYTQPVRTFLAIQNYRQDDPAPYDDTGWTLDELRHVTAYTVVDSAVLTKSMSMLTADATVEGTLSGAGTTLLVRHIGDWRSAVLPWRAGVKLTVADSAFTSGGATYAAGTYILDSRAAQAVKDLGLDAVAVAASPTVRSHVVTIPRIALMHSWIETQNEGWVRFALDEFKVPYTYISDQDLRKAGTLDRIDVVVFPHVSGPPNVLLNGRPMIGPPIPWKKTALTPNLDKWDQTDDVRPGMGLDGAGALRRFIERGGLLLVEGNSVMLPLQVGFNPSVSVTATPRLNARGGIYKAQVVDHNSPILYGYESSPFAVYFSQAPVLTVQPRDTSRGPDGMDPSLRDAAERMRAKVVLQFYPRADSLLVSGMLFNGEELAGKAAVVDAPVGNGHMVMFGIRPFWRWETHGSMAMAINAIANWNHLDPDPKAVPARAAGGDAANKDQ